jgi:hypothetical protein
MAKTNGKGKDGKAHNAHKETKMAESNTAVVEAPANLSATDERVPESYRALVASGAIVATVDKVKVEVKGKPEPAVREYIRLTAASIEGALALVGGRMNKVAEGDDKGNGVLDYFNYGFDLGVRSNERNKLLATLEGPEAAIKRAVKGLVAAGLPEATAAVVAVNALKAEGKLPADYVLPTGFSIATK